MEADPHSPISQVDGQGTLKDEVSFTFKSEYVEEVMRFSLGEIFPPFVASLDSRVRLGRLVLFASGTPLDKQMFCSGQKWGLEMMYSEKLNVFHQTIFNIKRM